MSKCLKLFLITLFGLFLASSASAQGSLYRDIAWRYTPTGVFPATTATVTVCTSAATGTPCTPKITVYSDSALSAPVANPLTACSTSGQVGCIDGLGNFSFYAAQGGYTYTISGAGLSAYGPIPFGLSCVAGVTCVSASANNNFTGDNTFCESNEVLYVGGAITCWTGADIAAQINTAYATACPSRGCRIHVLSQSSCYVATTAISFPTVAKPVLLEGDPGGASCISWAGASTSIVAILLDWGVSEKQSAGIRDLQIIGPGLGTTSTGVLLGSVSGTEASLISGLKCGTTAGLTDGFGLCIDMGVNNNDFIVKINNSFLMNSGVGLNTDQGSEGFYISDSLIARNTVGVNNTTGTDVEISNSSIDDNGTGISNSGGGTVECYGCHFENLGVPAASANYVVLTNSSGFISVGGSMQDDQAVGTTTQFIQCNSGAGYVGISHTAFATLGRTLTQIANLAGSCRANLQPRYTSLNISADFNQAYTGGPVFDCPIGAQIGVNNICGYFGTALQFRNGSGFVSVPGDNLYSLSVQHAGAPRALTLNDTGGPATWGFSYNSGSSVYQTKRGVAGCTTGAVAGNTCAGNVTITWATSFADANYTVSCQGNTPTNVPSSPYIVTGTKIAASVQVNYFAITAAAAAWATVECTATHD